MNSLTDQEFRRWLRSAHPVWALVYHVQKATNGLCTMTREAIAGRIKGGTPAKVKRALVRLRGFKLLEHRGHIPAIHEFPVDVTLPRGLNRPNGIGLAYVKVPDRESPTGTASRWVHRVEVFGEIQPDGSVTIPHEAHLVYERWLNTHGGRRLGAGPPRKLGAGPPKNNQVGPTCRPGSQNNQVGPTCFPNPAAIPAGNNQVGPTWSQVGPPPNNQVGPPNKEEEEKRVELPSEVRVQFESSTPPQKIAAAQESGLKPTPDLDQIRAVMRRLAGFPEPEMPALELEPEPPTPPASQEASAPPPAPVPLVGYHLRFAKLESAGMPPSFPALPVARMPPAPKFAASDDEARLVSRFLDAYRVGLTALTGKPCTAFKFGQPKKPQRERIRDACVMLRNAGIAPLSWVVWNVGNWRAEHGADSMPRLERIIHQGWVAAGIRMFDHDADPCGGGQILYGSDARALRARWEQMAEEVLDAATPEAVQAVVLRHFPGGRKDFDAAVRKIAVAAEVVEAVQYDEARKGAFIWRTCP